MIVAAMLAWYDEPLDELEGCIRSLPVLCDLLVAVDGAYQMTPGAQATSPPEQAALIAAIAKNVGIECDIHTPAGVWVGQVQKRDFMLRRAAQQADWVIAVDADHRLVGDRAAIRAELAHTQADSILHDFYTPPPPNLGDIGKLTPHPWHSHLCGETIEHSLLMRALDDMRVEKDHWGYSGVRDGQRRTLGKWRSPDYPEGIYYRTEALRVDHVCFHSAPERLERNRLYCAARDQFKASHGWEP